MLVGFNLHRGRALLCQADFEFRCPAAQMVWLTSVVQAVLASAEVHRKSGQVREAERLLFSLAEAENIKKAICQEDMFELPHMLLQEGEGFQSLSRESSPFSDSDELPLSRSSGFVPQVCPDGDHALQHAMARHAAMQAEIEKAAQEIGALLELQGGTASSGILRGTSRTSAASMEPRSVSFSLPLRARLHLQIRSQELHVEIQSCFIGLQQQFVHELSECMVETDSLLQQLGLRDPSSEFRACASALRQLDLELAAWDAGDWQEDSDLEVPVRSATLTGGTDTDERAAAPTSQSPPFAAHDNAGDDAQDGGSAKATAAVCDSQPPPCKGSADAAQQQVQRAGAAPQQQTASSSSSKQMASPSQDGGNAGATADACGNQPSPCKDNSDHEQPKGVRKLLACLARSVRFRWRKTTSVMPANLPTTNGTAPGSAPGTPTRGDAFGQGIVPCQGAART
eukprot:gb/GFBE01000215.1/.p1 GENE.gb/GFBE01000215.1/~~gb/GFBE01000215.1/.p1  ORF type:complete len:455 (+),score=77.63 gb/GFBE01000215.1/:1-1365(+)